MGAPTLYKWNDPGAPEIDGHVDSRSGIALLKAVLVDGYGTKPGAGWTIEYEDVGLGICVFRNNVASGGTGMYFQVTENGSVYCYYGRGMQFNSFEEMSSATEGTFQMPTLIANCCSRKCQYVTTTQKSPWIIIADDRCFYIFVQYTDVANFGTPGVPGTFNPTSYNNWFTFVGDIESFHPDDHYCFAMVSASSYSGTPNFGTTTYFNATSLAGHYIQRNAAGDTGWKKFYPLNGATTIGQMGGAYGNSGLPYPWNGQTILNRVLINDSVAYTLRGRLPGFYHPSHKEPWDLFEEFMFEGKSMLAVRWQCGPYKDSGCIDIGETFRT